MTFMIFTRSMSSSSMDFAISVLSLRFSWNSENTIESVEMEKETGVDGVLLDTFVHVAVFQCE